MSKKRNNTQARRNYIKKYGTIPTGYEVHHKLPIHAGGTDDPENLMAVTFEQHIELHEQRYKETGDLKDLMMVNFRRGGPRCGELNPFYGRQHTEETKQKQSISKKGKFIGTDNPFYGKQHTEESIEKNRKAHLGNKYCIGKHLSEETKQLIRNKKVKYIYTIQQPDGNIIKINNLHEYAKQYPEAHRKSLTTYGRSSDHILLEKIPLS